MPMQKQATGNGAWGHATCYVMVKSVECIGQPMSNPVIYQAFAKTFSLYQLGSV